MSLLRLTRPLNLLIIALTMVAMREGVIAGNLLRGVDLLAAELGTNSDAVVLPEGFGPQLSWPLFVLLVLSTVLIAAGGNVINDYFDTRIDRINKPDEVIVGRTVERRVAMTFHLVLSGAGLLAGWVVAWRSGLWYLGILPAFAIGALWTYSTTFKRRLFSGNGLVATLTALVPLTVGLYEIPLLERYFSEPRTADVHGVLFLIEPALHELWGWILAYTAFAFLATLVRELQKDMADVKGDAEHGCRTVPIVLGMRWARTLTLVYIGILLLGVLFVRSFLLRNGSAFWAISLGVSLPLLLAGGFTYQAVHRAEHVRAGAFTKVAMVCAVAVAFLVRHLP